MKKSIIVGFKGQDGQLLYKLLKSKNYSVLGIDIDFIHSTDSTWGKK